MAAGRAGADFVSDIVSTDGVSDRSSQCDPNGRSDCPADGVSHVSSDLGADIVVSDIVFSTDGVSDSDPLVRAGAKE